MLDIQDPILLLAPPRSFSTLICNMLGCHPQMFNVLETQLFDVDRMDEWYYRFGGRHHDGDGLRRSIAEVIFGAQNERTVNMAERWLFARQDWESAEVVSALVRELHPLILVEKTPIEKEPIEDSLGRRLHHFPRARFIHVIRHPVSHRRSLSEHLAKMVSSRNSRDIPRRISRVLHRGATGWAVDPQFFWLHIHTVILEFLKIIPPEQHIRLRGEDIFGSLDDTLQRIARWVGVRDDNASIEAMKHPENSPFARLGPNNSLYGADPNFLNNPIIYWDSDHTGRLPINNRLEEETLSEDTLKLAHYFGYR
jgi:hypothetical protein